MRWINHIRRRIRLETIPWLQRWHVVEVLCVAVVIEGRSPDLDVAGAQRLDWGPVAGNHELAGRLVDHQILQRHPDAVQPIRKRFQVFGTVRQHVFRLLESYF